MLRCARPPTHDCCNTTTQLISTRGHDIGSLVKAWSGKHRRVLAHPLPLPSLPLTCRPLVPSCWAGAPPAHHASSSDVGILPRQPISGEWVACTGFWVFAATLDLRPRTRQTGSRPEPNQWRRLPPPSYLRHASHERCLFSNCMGSADGAQEREGVLNRQSTSGGHGGGEGEKHHEGIAGFRLPPPIQPLFPFPANTLVSHAHMLTWRGATGAERPTRRLSRRCSTASQAPARPLCVGARPDADAKLCCWLCWVSMLLRLFSCPAKGLRLRDETPVPDWDTSIPSTTTASARPDRVAPSL